MINKLKRKIIILATLSMFVLMCFLIGTMNYINFRSMVKESDDILDVLSKQSEKKTLIDELIPKGINKEIIAESRYFTVVLTNDGNYVDLDRSNIIMIDDDSSLEYALNAFNSEKTRDFIGSFRYKKDIGNYYTKLTFLDLGRKIDTQKRFLLVSCTSGLCAVMIVFIIFVLIIDKLIKPIKESYEKQRRFIADASHEIKTPITIISANAEILKEDIDDECLDDIINQTGRLRKLTEELIELSKLDENQILQNLIEFPLSDVIKEVTESFKTFAEINGLAIKNDIEENVELKGNAKLIERLISILLDNALKYARKDSVISVSLNKKRKNIELKVSNYTDMSMNKDDLKHLFDRFYRADSSRNSSLGGSGIGLSVAKSIADIHKASISADINQDGLFVITVNF